MKKTILLLSALVFLINVYGQEEKLVSLTSIGQGKTKEEAKNNALRTAIEQAFGTFVSSNTSVVNDNLTKDEIINVSNGNIKEYTILSENMLQDNSWVVSLKADVSPSNLTKFAESKGLKAEFKGALFGANVKIMELNKKNESIAINNIYQILCEIVPTCYDYSLDVSEPKSDRDKWNAGIFVNAKFNDNIKNISDLIVSTLSGLSIPNEQLPNYKQLNINTYNCYIIKKVELKKESPDNSTKKKKDKRNNEVINENQSSNDLALKKITLRDRESISRIMYVLNSLLKVHCLYFKISNGIDTAFGYDLQCEGLDWYNKAGEREYFEPRRGNFSGFYYRFIYTNYSDHIISKYYKQQDLYLDAPRMPNFCYKNIWAREEGSRTGGYAGSSDSYSQYPEAYDILKQAAQNAGISVFTRPQDKSSYNRDKWDNEEYDQKNFLNLYSLQNNEIYFKIFLNNYLSTEEISKIKEYKVEPVAKKNWFD